VLRSGQSRRADICTRTLVSRIAASGTDLLGHPACVLCTSASNHASHADYGVAALRAGLDVYLEKTVATSRAQLVRSSRARRGSRGRLFAVITGRFPAAVRDPGALRWTLIRKGGFSLQCFVSATCFAADHWYRSPEEGTRICGNAGHWLDLFVHLLAWRGLPDRIEIALSGRATMSLMTM